jgi:hypothetical protein
VFVSTHDKDSGLFYDMVFGDNDAHKIVLDWKDNPTQTKLAFRWIKGFAFALREEEQELVTQYIEREGTKNLRRMKNRGYPTENVLLSPWYIAECLAPGITPRMIAKEYDRNPRGAVGKVFSVETLDKMQSDCCRQPVWEGDIILDSDTGELKVLKREEGGPLKLWFEPSIDEKRPPAGSYAIGCDISAGGRGDRASNSSLYALNRRSREQVCEYTVFGMMATIFARRAVAIAHWLNGAYLGWEATGPTGSQFASVVMEDLSYGNIYERDSGKPGWWNKSDADKGELFESLCIAFEDQEFIPRSKEMIEECGSYEWGEDGSILFKGYTGVTLAGKAGTAHGDRVVAAGVAWLLCKDRPMGGKGLDKISGMSDNAPPYGTFAWRQQQAERLRQAQQEDGGESEFSLADVLRTGGRTESWE